MKDIYLSHLAYLIEPHPDVLPAEVTAEIRHMPELFGVDVVPQRYEQLEDTSKDAEGPDAAEEE